MANHVCYMCGGDGMPSRLFRCVHCDYRQHTYCHSLFGSLTRFTHCDDCLKNPEGTARWVRNLAAIDFREVCEDYLFCTLCPKLFCGRCCPVSEIHIHSNHPAKIIQVIRHSNRLLIRPADVNAFYKCSDIQGASSFHKNVSWSEFGRRLDLSFARSAQPEIPDWVPLYPPVPGAPFGGKKWCGFGDCNREIVEPYEYCSIECRFKKEYFEELDTNMFMTNLLKPEFVQVHRRNTFCIICCAGFNSQFCNHHEMHNHMTLLPIVEIEGCLYARLRTCCPLKWLDALIGIQGISTRSPGLYQPYMRVSVPLRPPSCQPDPRQLPVSCRCGTPIVEDMDYCSVLCMAKYGELPDQ